MTKIIIPSIILFLQIAGIVFMFFITKKAPPDVPVSFVMIHFLAACNVIVLILSYFFYFNVENKINLWLIPISIAVINIIIVIIMQIMMFMGKL